MTIKGDMDRARRAVLEFDEACRRVAMKGAEDPLARDEIESAYKRSRHRLLSFIRTLAEEANET